MNQVELPIRINYWFELPEIELPITLIMTVNSTKSEIDNINFQWSSENRIQRVEINESDWNFQRINTMEYSFIILVN